MVNEDARRMMVTYGLSSEEAIVLEDLLTASVSLFDGSPVVSFERKFYV